MASQDYPLITDPHAPTPLPQTADSTTADYYAHSAFTTNENSDADKSISGSGSKRNPYYYKKQKTGNNSETASDYRVDYRKDREEWSDTAIACLLEAYTEKFNQLNRGNLRGRDWEEVAEAVSQRCGDGGYNGDNSNSSNDKQQQQKAWKSVEQCKNKIDNLKKRYKVELQRMNSSGSSSSNWHWFKQIETIMGNTTTNNNLVNRSIGAQTEERNGDGAASSIAVSPLSRQAKRYTPSNAVIPQNMKSKPQQNLKWQRVVFKISGSVLVGNCQNIDPKVVMLIAREVATACRLGVEVAIVLGGRNFFCGNSWITDTGFDRPTAYQMGMLATVMNSVLLQSALEELKVPTRVQSAFALPEVAEPYSRQRAIRHLGKGRVVIFGGIGAGTGNPLFTTDTAAALRASESKHCATAPYSFISLSGFYMYTVTFSCSYVHYLFVKNFPWKGVMTCYPYIVMPVNADAVLKGTNVNGIYDCHSGNSSVALEHISFREAISSNFTAMDTMALTYCEENAIPVVVFNLLEPGNISRALCGDQVGTLIDQIGVS